MKESAQIAHTVAKTFLSQVDADNDYLQKAHIHVHVPEVSNIWPWVGSLAVLWLGRRTCDQ